jgi:hypothetical protein
LEESEAARVEEKKEEEYKPVVMGKIFLNIFESHGFIEFNLSITSQDQFHTRCNGG